MTTQKSILLFGVLSCAACGPQSIPSPGDDPTTRDDACPVVEEPVCPVVEEPVCPEEMNCPEEFELVCREIMPPKCANPRRGASLWFTSEPFSVKCWGSEFDVAWPVTDWFGPDWDEVDAESEYDCSESTTNVLATIDLGEGRTYIMRWAIKIDWELNTGTSNMVCEVRTYGFIDESVKFEYDVEVF